MFSKLHGPSRLAFQPVGARSSQVHCNTEKEPSRGQQHVNAQKGPCPGVPGGIAQTGGQAGQRGEDLHQGPVQTRTVTWTTELFAVPCRALRSSQDQMVTSCASQTPCSRRASRLPRIFDDRMPGAANGDGRHRRQRDFPEAGPRWESGALSVHDHSSQL